MRRSFRAETAGPAASPDAAAGYARVSVVGDRGADSPSGRELVSPEVQIEAARAFCQLHGYALDEDLTRACVDLDRSGFKGPWRKRPGLLALYRAAQAGRIRHLIAYKLSRLARNAKEGLDIFAAFEAAGCQVHVVAEGIDTTTATGRLLRTILLAVAEMESENIAEFVRDTHRRQALAGVPRAPYPHWLARDRQTGQFRLLPEAVAALRRIVDLRLAGQSLTAITRALVQEGFPAPEGGAWTRQSVGRVLTPRYVDAMRGTSRLYRKRPDGEQIAIEGVYPAVLTPEEAAALRLVQQSARAAWPGRPPGEDPQAGRSKALDTPYLVSSIAWCATETGAGPCGGALISRLRTRSGTDGDRALRGYQCLAAARDPGAHPDGKGINIDAEMLEDAVVRVIREKFLAMPPAPRRRARPKAPRTAPRRSAEQIAEEVDALWRDHRAGIVAREDYERLMARLVAERAALAAQAAREEAPTAQDAAEAAIAALERGELTQAQAWRRLVLLYVERVDAPVYTGETFGGRSVNQRRWARVTLKYPNREGRRVFLAALYGRRYSGEREIREE